MATKFKDRPKNLMLNRAMVVAAGVSAFLALQYTYFSVHESAFDANTYKYRDENIGMGFLIVYALLPLILSLRYPLYWVFFSKNEKKFADERQLNVRKRVYEISYRLFAICALLAFYWFNHSDSRMQLVLGWFFGITFFMMPVMVAAWQKDS
ncbi:hypothetical protein KC992_00905 [Candidatus Saccharibacteria bacterium]|nr:hypothetical protein [Candidatus Saccharibacteria bacterium]